MMEERAGIYFKKVNVLIEKQINKSLKEYDLTMSQGRIIGYLNAHCDKEIYQKDIENEFNISHATLSGIISRLESSGFIRVDREKRSNKINLLQKCIMNEERVKMYQENLEKIIFKDFSELEKEKFISDLKRIYKNLREEEK